MLDSVLWPTWPVEIHILWWLFRMVHVTGMALVMPSSNSVFLILTWALLMASVVVDTFVPASVHVKLSSSDISMWSGNVRVPKPTVCATLASRHTDFTPWTVAVARCFWCANHLSAGKRKIDATYSSFIFSHKQLFREVPSIQTLRNYDGNTRVRFSDIFH